MKGNGIRFIIAANCDVLPPPEHHSQGEVCACLVCNKQLPTFTTPAAMLYDDALKGQSANCTPEAHL